jgi:hypothetical protein
MNAARLTRRWQEAAGDPVRMAEALVDEINDPATGLVTRDFLRAELAQLRGEIASSIAQVRGEITSSSAQVRGEITSSSAQLRGEISQLETRLTWRMITLLGVQIALVGILVTILFQVLR